MKQLYNNDPFENLEDSNDQMVPIIADFGEVDMNITFETENLPILPLRNMVMFPHIPLPVSIGREKSMKLIKDAEARKLPIGVFCQMNPDNNEPGEKDIYKTGVVAEILRVLEMPDGTTTVILQGKKRIELKKIVQSEPYLLGDVMSLEEKVPDKQDKEFKALVASIKDYTFQILKSAGGVGVSKEVLFSLRNITDPLYLVNFICAQLPIDPAEKQRMLLFDDFKKRCYFLVKILSREAQLMELKANIQHRTREEMDQQQREYFLQQQIKTIQEELGGSANEMEIKELRAKAAKKKWSKEINASFEKEMKKLERLHPQSPDYSTQVNYLQTFVELPWNEYTEDNFDLVKAQKVLDRDHYGLEKVKERIIEHLAVLKLKGDLKSPIICLYGPPGVGKTSLGKSVADALKRKYVRISLGGLHDESEIRGHRRTYIGAMPGRIIKGIQKAGSSNPVFILDEIDKIGNDFKGDPSAALLEVLDPEQNSTFHDNYLDVDFDLSKVLFIATANNLNSISQPLLDRMELIDISGYIIEEKVEIARKHLVPKQIANHGIPKRYVSFAKGVLEHIVSSYTRESGVRELDKQIAQIMRRIARKVAEALWVPKSLKISDIEALLGKPKFSHDRYSGNQYAGVVTGLAWTAVGGDILYIESSLSKGKGKLTLTGNLGEVMKESAVLALEYLKAHASDFGINEEAFDKWNVHIHVPEGAIPKDGPSAGITMTTSLASAFLQRKVKSKLAMTGEITLRGAVLPVGGIKEKILAAKRAGIEEIILCEENRKDIEEINNLYLQGLTFHYVKDIREVLEIAITNEPVDNPINLNY